MSWNILGDANAANNPYLYKSCDMRSLARRQPRIIQALVSMNADVIALQEVEYFERDFAPALKAAGMQGVFKQRTGSGQVDGVALVWRANRLTLLHSEALEYARLLTEGVTDQASIDKFGKGNVGLIGTFRDNHNGRELIVATTHLLWNPSRGLVKLRQAQCVLGRVAELQAARPSAAPHAAESVDALTAAGGSAAASAAPATPTPEIAANAAPSDMTSSDLPAPRAAVILGDFYCTPRTFHDLPPTFRGFPSGDPRRFQLHAALAAVPLPAGWPSTRAAAL